MNNSTNHFWNEIYSTKLEQLLDINIEEKTVSVSVPSERNYETIEQFEQLFLEREHLPYTDKQLITFEQLLNSQEPLKRIKIIETTDKVEIRDYLSKDERHYTTIITIIATYFVLSLLLTFYLVNDLIMQLLFSAVIIMSPMILLIPLEPIGLFKANQKITITPSGIRININRFIPYSEIMEIRLATTAYDVLTIEIVTKNIIFTLGRLFFCLWQCSIKLCYNAMHISRKYNILVTYQIHTENALQHSKRIGSLCDFRSKQKGKLKSTSRNET